MDCSRLFIEERLTDGIPWSFPLLLTMLSAATLALSPPSPFAVSSLLEAAALWLPLQSEPLDGSYRGEPDAVSLTMEFGADIELATPDLLRVHW